MSGSVPVIDISPLLKSPLLDTAESIAVANAIGDACKTWGFFQVNGTNVSAELQSELVRSAKEFYALPDDEKMKIHVKKGGVAWRGYMPHGGEGTHGRVDQKEGLYFGYENAANHPHSGMPLHGNNQFPSAVPEMHQVVLEYIDRVVELGCTLCDAISLALELDPHFIREHFLQPEPIPLFRCFNYRSTAEAESQNKDAKANKWGIGEHTDFGLLTILKQDSAGLQVRSPGTEDWVDVPVIENGFVVNVGDMLDMLTSGRFRSRPHRVVLPPPGSQRISFPFFFDFSWTANMECLPLDHLSPLTDTEKAEAHKRWNNGTFRSVQGQWWQYLARKVQKVFPDLALPDFEPNSAPSSRFSIVVPVVPELA